MKTYKAESYTDNGIYIFKGTGKSGAEEHTHNFLEIIYTLSGGAREWVDGREYSVKRGDCNFLLVCSSFPEEDIPFFHYELLSDRSDIRTKTRDLQTPGIKVFKSEVGKAIFLCGLFLFGAIESYLFKAILCHLRTPPF